MVPKNLVIYIGLILSLICKIHCVCDKKPPGVSSEKNRNDAGRYRLEIPGNPQNYIPHQRYNITLRTSSYVIPKKSFKTFMITLEPVNPESSNYLLGQLGYNENIEKMVRFTEQCRDTLIEANLAPKTEIQVHWTAPPMNSGCIAIKATVVESRDNWFSEDGPLTKTLCEDTTQDENSQPHELRRCCACDEAKYEIAFEGKWTRNTHPKNFPMDQWNTRFSDVIGASHQRQYAFWEYEHVASDGLRELAEEGSTKALEAELKNKSEHIRTIIKARGLQYPNITKSTYAVFRVDRKNHLMSLVSKIIPSPDWIVGVSNLELCKPDCTWEESRTLNLYPWDAGTNRGLGYTDSEPLPFDARQPIIRISPNNPHHPLSPFFSEDGDEMKPIAKLHLTKQRLYHKNCGPESEEADCSTTEWSRWSPCTVNCGEGVMYRTRDYINKDYEHICDVNLTESRPCQGINCYRKYSTTNPSSSADSEEETQTSTTISAQEDDDCGEDCKEDPNCPGTFWGPWKECNANCGQKGNRTRMRMKKSGNDESEDLDESCIPQTQYEECDGACHDNEKGNLYGSINSNNYIRIVEQAPDGKVVNCKVSAWSTWSGCRLNVDGAVCGEGRKYKVRQIVRHPENGGQACPKHLRKEKKCAEPCPRNVQCTMGRWTNWSFCPRECSTSPVQIRTRDILYQPPGVACPKVRETRNCHLPAVCGEYGKSTE